MIPLFVFSYVWDSDVRTHTDICLRDQLLLLVECPTWLWRLSWSCLCCSVVCAPHNMFASSIARVQDVWSQKQSEFSPFSLFSRPTSHSSRTSCPTTSSSTPPWTPSSSTRTRSSSTSSPRRTEPRSYCITSVCTQNYHWPWNLAISADVFLASSFIGFSQGCNGSTVAPAQLRHEDSLCMDLLIACKCIHQGVRHGFMPPFSWSKTFLSLKSCCCCKKVTKTVARYFTVWAAF